MELSEVQILAGIVVAMGGLVLSWLKWIWPMWINFREKRKKNRQLLEEIAEQLKPNGGNSLRDSVNRIERNTNVNRQMMKFHFDVHGTPYVVMNKDCEVTDIGVTVCDMLERKESDLTGNNFYTYITDNRRNEVVKDIRRAAMQERKADIILDFFKPDGKVIKAQMELRPIMVNGELERFVGTVKKVG